MGNNEPAWDVLVPPGFIAGSGLKQYWQRGKRRYPWVPPGFIAGSGLKLELKVQGQCNLARSSRLHRRERIETTQPSPSSC